MPVTPTSSLPPSLKRRARVDEKDILEECQFDTPPKVSLLVYSICSPQCAFVVFVRDVSFMLTIFIWVLCHV